MTKAICVWLDATDGEPKWIVSSDHLDPAGQAESSMTLAIFDDEDAAMKRGEQEAMKRGLPLYRNPINGPAQLVKMPIADGTYFLYPDGSAWIAARFSGGRLVATTAACDAASHAAANDQWAGDVPPTDADTELSAPDALPIIREVMGDDVLPELVIVTRAAV